MNGWEKVKQIYIIMKTIPGIIHKPHFHILHTRDTWHNIIARIAIYILGKFCITL